MIKKIVESYGIYPLKIDRITDSLFRIDDGHKRYALKRSSLCKQTISAWEMVLQQASLYHVTEIIPVYITNNGLLYKEYNQEYYYLLPWIDHDQQSQKQAIKQMYQTLGSIHAKTKQPQIIDHDLMKDQFNHYKQYCIQAQHQILAIVKKFEENKYMSPFELQVCTHYRDIDLITRKIVQRIEQLIHLLDEETQWNYCLCHNNLKLSHILASNQLYISNWERATINIAAEDLAVFFENEMTTYDSPRQLFMDQFAFYTEINSLDQNELFLLIIHLLNPAAYLKVIDQYMTKPTERTMVNQVKQLQILYRKLIFGLEFSNFIEKDYETISFEDI